MHDVSQIQCGGNHGRQTGIAAALSELLIAGLGAGPNTTLVNGIRKFDVNAILPALPAASGDELKGELAQNQNH